MSLKHGILLALLAGIVVPAIAQQLAPSGSDSNSQPTVPPSNPPAAVPSQPGGQAVTFGNDNRQSAPATSLSAADANRAAATRTPNVPADAPRSQRDGVDETALRYFAAQGDTRRLEAEIARLRALYPNWTPPADFGQVQGDPELERMWKLYAEGKYAEVRGAIAQRVANDPSWVVPEDLLARLDEGESRRRLVNASDAGQWNQVISIATETPTMLTCGSVDLIWRVAEAYVKVNNPDRALSAFSYILTSCENPQERVATMQKAMGVLPDDQIEQLMKYERNGEFEPVRDDLARRRVNAAALDPKKTAAQEDLDRLARLARDNPTNVQDALSLGWYDFHHRMVPASLDWFKMALDRNGGSKAAEGVVYAMSALDQLLQAEPIAYEWRTAGQDNLKAYLDLMVTIFSQDDPPLKVEPDILNRFTAVLEQTKYALGAQAVGFYAYNTSQFSTAARWFQTALRWQPDMEPAAYGLALCGLRIPNRELFNDVVNVWRDRSARIYELTLPPDQRRPQRPSPPLVGDLSQPVTILPSPSNVGYGPAYRPATTARSFYDYRLPQQLTPPPPQPYPPVAQGYGTQAPYGTAGYPYAGQPQAVAPTQRVVVQSTPRGTSPNFSGAFMPGTNMPPAGSPTTVMPSTFLKGTSSDVAAAPVRTRAVSYYDPRATYAPPAAYPQAAYPQAAPTYAPAPAAYSGPAPTMPAPSPYVPRPGSSNSYEPAPALRPAGNPVAYNYEGIGPRVIYGPGAPSAETRVAFGGSGSTAGYLASSRIVTADSDTYTASIGSSGRVIQLAQASTPPTVSGSAPAGSPTGPNVTNNVSTSNAIANQGGATYASPGSYRTTSPPADYYSVATQPSAYNRPVYSGPRYGSRYPRRVSSGGGGTGGLGGCGGVNSRVLAKVAGSGAVTVGWCLMDLDRPLEARQAFERALMSNDPQVRQEAAYGKSLALLRKGLTDEAALAAAEAPQTVRRSVQLGSQILTQRAVAAYQDKKYVAAIIALDERARLVPEQVDMMMIRGWSYFELGRYDEAEQLFRAVQRTGLSRDGAKGVAAIMTRTRQLGPTF